MHEGSQEYALLDAVIQVSPSVQVTVDSARFNAKVGSSHHASRGADSQTIT